MTDRQQGEVSMATQQVGIVVSSVTEEELWTKLGNPHRVRTWFMAEPRF